MSIQLSTESGKWKYEASLDDKFFGEYLTSLAEVGEVPEKVVFRGSVAEVIEEEWEIALWLTMWIDNMESSYDTRDMNDLLMFIPAFTRLIPLYDTWLADHWGDQLPNVYLKDVARISNILTLPKNWRMYVKAGNEVSKKEAVDHILAASEEVALAHQDILSYSRNRGVLHETVNGSVMYYIKYIQDEEEHESKIGQILWTLARDAAMTKLDKDRYTTAITPLDFRWDVVLECMERLDMEKDSLAWHTALSFVGRGDPNGFTVTPALETELSEFGQVHLLEGDQRGLTSSMYTVLMPQLSDELLLQSFKCIDEEDGIINEIDALNGEYCDNALLKFPFWIHNVIGAQLSSYNLNMKKSEEDLEGFMIEEEDYYTYIYLLDHFVAGRKVLDRLAAIKNSTSHGERWSKFLSIVREHVMNNEEPELSLLFPTPSDIARAKVTSKKRR